MATSASSNQPNIPFVDLQSQLKPIRSEIMAGFEAVLDKCNFILGEEVGQFERAFAEYCQAKYCVAVASGLDALHLALRAVGLQAGDEVIVPANTFIASALGASMLGAIPKVVDVEAKTFLLDPNKIEAAITKKTKAIMPVHLYGRMMNLEPVLAIAKKYNLAIVEDAAQAHGAKLKNQKAGTVGQIGCYSFYPGKNLGCYGDGGAVATNDEALKAKVEALRNYGSTKKYYHPEIGFNSRLDTLQAVVLKAKLKHLDEYNRLRYEAAINYNKALEGVGDLIIPEIPEAGAHVFHLYVVRTKKRDELVQYLNAHGVGSVIHYPTPIHLHGAYANLGYRQGDFKVAEQLSGEILSLPMFPELTQNQIDRVASTVRDFFKH